jgi:hypothetical protein
MGLGLVLMLAGDGEMARRAGDALIADKVQDAIEEGGFESVEYESWDKGFDGGRFWVGFEDVRVRRDGASLGARVAVIYPMSVLMDFERGRVRLGPEAGAWRFASVRISGAYSLFRRGLTVEGTNLRHEGPADELGRFGEAECLFEDACGFGYPLDPSGLERFRLTLERSGRSAGLRFTWPAGDRCHEIRAIASRSRLALPCRRSARAWCRTSMMERCSSPAVPARTPARANRRLRRRPRGPGPMSPPGRRGIGAWTRFSRC